MNGKKNKEEKINSGFHICLISFQLGENFCPFLERSIASMDHSLSEAVMRYAKCTSLLKIWKVWHSTVTPKADLSS